MRTPKYRRHSVRNTGFVEWQGNRIYLPGVYNSAESKLAYRKFLSEHAFAEPPRPKRTDGQLFTVAGLVTQYLDHARIIYPGDNSEYDNCRHALVPLSASYGMVEAAQFGPLKLKEYQQALADKKLRRSYINGTIGKIRRAFSWAVSEQLIEPSVLAALVTVPGLRNGRSKATESPKREPVPWEHIEPILEHLSPLLRAMTLLQWYVGPRSKSICLSVPEQFERSGKLWLWHPRHKTESMGKEVVLPIGKRCQAVLLPFIEAARPGEPIFNPRTLRKNPRYNDQYSSNTYRQAVRRAIAKVNKIREAFNEGKPEAEKLKLIPLWTPHQLRHSVGTEVRDRYGVEAAQAVLGHAKVDTTQLYSRRRLKLAEKVARNRG